MGSRNAQISLFLVATLVGILLVGQLRSQARPTEISSLSAQDLSQLIDTLSSRNRELRSGLADVREQLREYRVSGPQSQSAVEVGREDLRRILAFSGALPVSGQGIAVTVEGSLDSIALNDLINEMRNAGAEAIAVDAIRITAASVAEQGPRALVVDGVDVGGRFVMRAIGAPDGLQAALERPGGIIAQLEQFINATISIRQEAQLNLPASARSLVPGSAQPVSAVRASDTRRGLGRLPLAAL
jgi:uncharacterized protein YlxW (UPF0749 family)